MESCFIHDRGRGPELVGTRITVYHLLPSFLDPTLTESDICQIYQLTTQQVAAARAYVLSNPETVLAEHLKIEERLAAGNPPEVRERAQQTRTLFVNFKEWLTQREASLHESGEEGSSSSFPSFREWLHHQVEH